MTRAEKRNLLAGAIGNTIEFYDFIIYAYLAVFVAEHFFPHRDGTTGLLASYGAFASGMLMRPLGGILFGTIGDRFGRKTALQLSVLLIALPTLVIGLMPTFGTIGIAAPLILIALRMLQGLSVGGEYASAVVFLIESVPPSRRGYAGSFGPLGAVGGLLLGTLMTFVTTLALGEERMHDWGWRVPFIASAVLTVLGIALRRSLAAEKVERATGSPLREAFTGYWRQMLAIALANISTAIVSFVAFMFAVPWIERNSEPDTVMALMANLVGLVTTCATSLIGGRLGDHLGRRRIALLGLAELVLVAWPAFMLMLSGNFLLMALGSALLGVGQGLFTGAFCAMMVTLLPRRVRVTGMAFSYSLATGAAGGLAPMLAEYLVDRAGIVMAPALVVMVAAALSLAVIALHPMWRHNDESLPEDHKAAGGISSPTRDIGAVGFSFRRAAAEGGGQRIRE